MGNGQVARFFVTIQNPVHLYGSPLLPGERLFRMSDFPGCVYLAQSPIEKGSTVHVHCVLMFDNRHRMTFSALRKLLLPYAGKGGVSHEEVRGSRGDIEDYFLKRGEKWEEKKGQQCFGGESYIEGVWVESGRGKRNDIGKVKALIDSGVSDKELWDSHFGFMLRNSRAVKEYKKVSSGVRSWKTELWLYLGVPGTGKSYHARTESGLSVYCKPACQWWDLYEGQEVVVIDEFERHKSFVKYHDLLVLADDSPLLVEVKNGFVQFLAKKLVITANSVPVEWFADRVKKGLGISALVSRLTGVRVYWHDNGMRDGVRSSFKSSRGGVEVKAIYQEYVGVKGVESFIREMNEGLSSHSFGFDSGCLDEIIF